MTPEPRRKVPAKAALHAALYQLGFEPHEVELDHDPALALRPVDPVTGEHIPHQHDPKALIWRPKADHARKTTGRRGESRLSISGDGDVSRAAKARRLAQSHEEFRARLTAPKGETPASGPRKPGKRAWPKKSFPKGKRRFGS